jgi:hypothetical protein
VCPLAKSWRIDAATAYLDTLRSLGLALEASGDRLRIPVGHTPGEVELVRLLKPELLSLLVRDAPKLPSEPAPDAP